MKKITLLIIIVLLLSGCSDYQELNSLSYITGIGIDYKEDKYIVTYEVMDNKKDGSGIKTETYTVTGTGKTNIEAQYNATEKLNNTAYFAHSQVIILTENLVKEKLFEITDSIIRNPKLNEEFQFVIASDNTPKEIFEATSTQNPSVSLYIDSLINNNEYSKNYMVKKPFAIFAQNLFEDKIDPAVSIIKVDDDNVIIDGMAIFKNGYYDSDVNNDYSNLYLSMIDKSVQIIETIEYNNHLVEALITFDKIDTKVETNYINIDINSIIELKQIAENVNLYDNSVYSDIALEFSKKLKSKVEEFIKDLQIQGSDILGFENIFYLEYRKENKELWKTASLNVNIDSSISRKGLIYNVHN